VRGHSAAGFEQVSFYHCVVNAMNGKVLTAYLPL
jgi:hypothetical protein